MKHMAGLGAVVALTLVQVTWAPRLEVAGAFPNLMLLAVVGVTWIFGLRAGMVWACAGGVLLDLTAAGPIGLHALALLVGTYTIGFFTPNIANPTAFHFALSAALSTVLYSAVLVLAAGLLGNPVPAAGVAIRLASAAALYNALLMPLAVEVLRRLQVLAPGAAAT